MISLDSLDSFTASTNLTLCAGIIIHAFSKGLNANRFRVFVLFSSVKQNPYRGFSGMEKNARQVAASYAGSSRWTDD